MILELPIDMEKRLIHNAQKQGLSIEDYIISFLIKDDWENKVRSVFKEMEKLEDGIPLIRESNQEDQVREQIYFHQDWHS